MKSNLATPRKVEKRTQNSYPDLSLRSPSIDTNISNTPTNKKPKNSLQETQASPKSLSFPLSPSECIQTYQNQLSDFEISEIQDYCSIFYIGNFENKIRPRKNLQNFGFDDHNADFNLIEGDHLAYRYEIFKEVGIGSYGLVAECFDHKRKETVAVKIIKNKKHFHQEAAIEINILKKLKDSRKEFNIVQMKNYFYFRQHVCIVFEILHINLYELLERNNFQGVELDVLKKFAYELFVSLYYLQEKNIMHCDLKPENIMLKSKKRSEIRLIDFGSACYVEKKAFKYIQSRFYRAPEVILGIPQISAIDVWSLGCILCELFTSKPLFPAKSEMDLFALIVELKGHLPESLLVNAKRLKFFFKEGVPRMGKNRYGMKREPGSKNLNEVLRCPDPDFVDLVSRCLEWHPLERITPEEAFMHPWFQDQNYPSNNSRIKLSKTRSMI